MSTLDKVRDIIAEVLEDVEAADIKAESRFGEELDVHSMDMVEMMYAVEETFDISTEDWDMENLKTVGDVVTRIEAGLAAA